MKKEKNFSHGQVYLSIHYFICEWETVRVEPLFRAQKQGATRELGAPGRQPVSGRGDDLLTPHKPTRSAI